MASSSDLDAKREEINKLSIGSYRLPVSQEMEEFRLTERNTCELLWQTLVLIML